MLPILPQQRHSLVNAALAPDNGKPPPMGGGGLGGLKPPPARPTIPGTFGRPKPSQAHLSPLGMYLLNMHG